MLFPARLLVLLRWNLFHRCQVRLSLASARLTSLARPRDLLIRRSLRTFWTPEFPITSTRQRALFHFRQYVLDNAGGNSEAAPLPGKEARHDVKRQAGDGINELFANCHPVRTNGGSPAVLFKKLVRDIPVKKGSIAMAPYAPADSVMENVSWSCLALMTQADEETE